MRIKWIEFFHNNQGQMSMSRLLSFMAFFPATVVLLWVHTAEALIAYMGVYGATYLGGKGFDAFNKDGK